MSIILDRLLDQAANGQVQTVTLSPGSLAVLLFASSFLSWQHNWIDTTEDPFDEITESDWDEIEKLVGNMIYEALTPESPTEMAIIGEVRMYTSQTLPDGWLACYGQELLRADYPELFAVIGTEFQIAADGTHFNIPDYRNRFPLGANYSGVGTLRGLGDMGGAVDHTLTENEMPVHNHPPLTGQTTFLGNGTGGNTAPAGSGLVTKTTTGNRGGGVPHNNMPPYTGIMFMIYTGVLP